MGNSFLDYRTYVVDMNVLKSKFRRKGKGDSLAESKFLRAVHL